MLSILKDIKAVLVFLFLLLHTFLLSIPLYMTALCRLVLPKAVFQITIIPAVIKLIDFWLDANKFAAKYLFGVEIELQQEDELYNDRWYLLSANHQNWFDIFALYAAVHRKIPFVKAFVKHQIHYYPFIHLSIWAMDCPAMKRYSKEKIAKNPELRKVDWQRAKQAMADMQTRPASMMNFSEGTRFTQKKHDKQNSPYQHLLNPKSGGLAFAIESFGNKLAGLLDVTIIYPQQNLNFWSFLRGDVKKIIVHTRVVPIPEHFFQFDYQEDEQYRQEFKAWLDNIWHEKDQRIHQGMQKLQGA